MRNHAAMRRGLLVLLAAPALLCAPAQAAPFPTTASKLNLRAKPAGKTLARLPRGTVVDVTCQRNGPLASGRAGATRIWDRVRVRGRQGWVGDGWVATDPTAVAAPLCTTAAPACTPAAPFPLLPPFATPQDFIAAALPGAQASRDQFGVPVSVTLAQGVLETGGGRLAALANNFFGLKARASDPPGPCVLKKTREVRNGRDATEIGAFKAYATLDESILDHGRRLATNPAYAPAFAHTGDPDTFARLVARRYATDPAYAAKLLDLMDRYELRAHDQPA